MAPYGGLPTAVEILFTKSRKRKGKTPYGMTLKKRSIFLRELKLVVLRYSPHTTQLVLID